jgi:DNA-binding response OmpR family regulator
VIISAYTKTDYLLESVELKLDQYIVKPLTSTKIHELLKKLDTVFSSQTLIILVPGVWIDQQISTITFEEKRFFLTKRELAFLSIIAKNKFISYDEMSALWEDEVPSQNAIRSYIKHLRKKLPPDLLKNRNGMGYSIEQTV